MAIGKRNLCGLIAHNLLRHVDAAHKGKYNAECRVCSAHLDAFSNEREKRFQSGEITGDLLVLTERWLEER